MHRSFQSMDETAYAGNIDFFFTNFLWIGSPIETDSLKSMKILPSKQLFEGRLGKAEPHNLESDEKYL